MKRIAASAAAALFFAGGAVAQQASTDAQAIAAMKGADGADHGTITFTQTKSGVLHVVVEMTGLPPGPHGFHIHEKGECDGAQKFESAGGHYAGGKEHGVDAENGPHPGDFPNVHVGQDGVLKAEFFTRDLSLGEGGTNPLMDADGSAAMIHAQADDHASQPSGEAGDRIACGVVAQPG